MSTSVATGTPATGTPAAGTPAAAPPAPPTDRPDRGGAGPEPVRGWTVPALATLVAIALVPLAGAVPFLHRPLTSDESGFLLLARHWTRGTSLYGNYWVDRPPLLIWLFSLAGLAGPGSHTAAGLTAPAVRALGAAADVLTVLLAGVLGRAAAPGSRWARWAGPVLAAGLLADPLFGMPETDGEALAAPFVMLGLLCLVQAVRRPSGRGATLMAASAGAAAMAAALVKQNVVDVFVFALVLVVVAGRRIGARRVRTGAVAFALGAGTVLAVILAGAALRGTGPAALWDAVVTFRVQASAVISASASPETSQRLWRTASAFVLSGGAAVLVAGAVLVLRGLAGGRRAGGPDIGPLRPAVAWAALAMTAWELCGVVAGGSYWLHYLTGVVPGLVLLIALAHPGRRARPVLAALLCYVVVIGSVTWVQHAARPTTVSSDAEVAAYLREHAAPGDGVVVAFGHPGIVADSGLTSPYEHLWSLPVRVRDPRLAGLQQVMSGPRAPAWVVVSGARLDSWGLDAASAQRYLEDHYTERGGFGDWHIWHRASPG
jgi:hypothetical protein